MLILLLMALIQLNAFNWKTPPHPHSIISPGCWDNFRICTWVRTCCRDCDRRNTASSIESSCNGKSAHLGFSSQINFMMVQKAKWTVKSYLIANFHCCHCHCNRFSNLVLAIVMMKSHSHSQSHYHHTIGNFIHWYYLTFIIMWSIFRLCTHCSSASASSSSCASNYHYHYVFLYLAHSSVLHFK